MKRKNYLVLLLLAIITFSLSSCVVIDNPEDDIVMNTPAALCGKQWVETYTGVDKEGQYSCEHTIYFNLDGTGHEIYVYRAVDKYGNIVPGNPYQIDNGLDNPEFRFQWALVSSATNGYMTIALNNTKWSVLKSFKNIQVRRTSLTGIFEGQDVVFYNRGF